MKKLSKFFLLLPIFFIGCETLQTTTAPTKVSVAEPTLSNRIHNGMSKNQVLRLWGEPSSKQVSSEGEIWTYGNEQWKRIIPYAGPFLPVSTAKVMFSGGRVVKYRQTDRGNMMSDREGMMPGHIMW